MRRSRILLLIPHLGGGGAERVTELLARHLSDQKYDLHLGVVTPGQVAISPLPSSVTIHALGSSRVRGSLPRLLRLIRRLRPDVILSTMAHLNFAVLLLRPLFPRGTRVLVRQNGTASAMLADLSSPAFTRALYRILYTRADRILCQSVAMADDLHLQTNLPRHRLAVVPNPVDINVIRASCALSPIPSSAPHLISRRPLRSRKGNDLLLDAFGCCLQGFPVSDPHHRRPRDRRKRLEGPCRKPRSQRFDPLPRPR